LWIHCLLADWQELSKKKTENFDNFATLLFAIWKKCAILLNWNDIYQKTSKKFKTRIVLKSERGLLNV